MTSFKINQFRQIQPLKSNILLVLFFSINFCFGQAKIINEIKTYNDEGNYQKSLKQIIKYRDKDNDTLNYNYLICQADYYCISNNTEYNPFKAISIINNISCEKITPEYLGIFFKDNQECTSVIKEKKDKYVGLYFEAIYKSNDIDSLKSFNKEFSSYTEMTSKISVKIITIKFNLAKRSNSKDELMKFQNEFPSSQYEQDVLTLIEELDYSKAISLNTIESYSLYLKSYPKSNKYELIQSKLADLSWEQCLQINTKETFQRFINNFPNSSKLAEAKLKISKFVDIFDLSKINSFRTISVQKKMFEPCKLENGKIEVPRLTFLAISNNGRIALAINQFADSRYSYFDKKKAYLINLLDGYIFYAFDYESIANYFFDANDTKLFYFDNKFIKQLDLASLEVTNLFELETKGYSINNVILDHNTIHVCQDQYESPRKKILHYSYDLLTSKKELEVFYEFDYSVRDDIQKQFDFISGSTEQKLLMLKLIHGDNIQIKPLTNKSKDEYLILNFPNIFIFQNGRFTLAKSLQLYNTDQTTKEVKPYYYDRSQNEYNRGYGKIQLTTNNEIVFAAGKSLFVLKLDNENNEYSDANINFQHVDPMEIKISTNDRYMFAHLDSKSGKLFYQVDIGYGCDYNSDYEIYVFDIRNNFHKNEKDAMKDIMLKHLKKTDETLYSFYNSYINTETLKNQPLESDVEKYARVRDINSKINSVFIYKKDSLYQIINNIIEDSIKAYKYEAADIFNVQNYDQTFETWRLVFKNPYNGKDFSLLYPQSKSEAKLNLSNKFLNLDIEVKFYFNLISLTFEPLLVSITNTQSKITNKFIVPYRDASLLKNIYLTNNSYIDNYGTGGYLDCRLMRGDITLDENILRYFVNNGKPKYYFNYGFEDPAQSNKPGVSIRNVDDLNINYVFQDEFIACCPSSQSYEGKSQFLRFNNVPYFINLTESYPDKEKTKVFEINNKVPLGQDDSVLYPNGESPNGKYFVDTSGVYDKASGNCLLKFQNASGKVYWDCNSYYFGIGYDVFPVSLLETVLK
jgi:hypothetical protein